MGSSGSEQSLRRDQGLRGCSSRFSVEVEDVMEPVRRPRTRSQSQVPQPMNIDDDDDDEEWKYSSEGFSLRSAIEEQRYNSCKERIRSNLDLDHDFMKVLNFDSSIEKSFLNLGWGPFIHISASYQSDLALEIMTTMDIVQSSDGISTLRFRLKENWTDISFGTVGALFGFHTNAPESIEVDNTTLENFWLRIASGHSKERMKIINPILRIIHRFMTVRVLERMDDTKVQIAELKWLYIALCQPTWTNPINAMINHWIVQRNRATGLLGYGHYLMVIAFSLIPNLVSSPAYTVLPASIDENSLKKGKYIFGNSSTGFYVAKTKFRIPDRRLSLFIQNKTDWLEKFMFEEEPSQQTSSEWDAWTTPNQQFPSSQFGAGSSQGPVYQVRPISSYDPTSTPVFQPSGNIPPPAVFIPRNARSYDPDFIAAQQMPHRSYYGIETMTARNYGILDHVRENLQQYEQNTQNIEEQLFNLRLWDQNNQGNQE